MAVGATASSSAPFSSATGTGTSSDVVFPTYNAVFNQTSVNSSDIVNATATTASQTYSLPYSRPYGTAGIVNGNGTTLGVATGVVGGDKVILSFEGGAGLGKGVGITLLGVASGVGIWFGGWMIW